MGCGTKLSAEVDPKNKYNVLAWTVPEYQSKGIFCRETLKFLLFDLFGSFHFNSLHIDIE